MDWYNLPRSRKTSTQETSFEVRALVRQHKRVRVDAPESDSHLLTILRGMLGPNTNLGRWKKAGNLPQVFCLMAKHAEERRYFLCASLVQEEVLQALAEKIADGYVLRAKSWKD